MITVKQKDKFSATNLSTEDTTREGSKHSFYSKYAKNTIYVDGAHMLNSPTKQYILSWTKIFFLTIVLFTFIFDNEVNCNIIGYIAFFNYGLYCLSLLTFIIMIYRRSHVDEESDLIGNITFISLKTQKEIYMFLLSLQLWISIWYFYVFDNKNKGCKLSKIKNTEEYVREKFKEFICHLTVPTYYLIIGTIIITLYQIGSFAILKRL